MKLSFIYFPFLLLFHFSILSGQNPQKPEERYRKIDTISNERFQILEYSKDSVLLFKGTLSSLDPVVRDGKFYFFDPKGRIRAFGMYRMDIPFGKWIYYDSLMQPVEVLDYSQALQALIKEDSEEIKFPSWDKRSELTGYKQPTKDGLVFIDADKEPTFRGENFYFSFTDYFYTNRRHPAYADALDTSGLVGIKFIIDTEGRVRQPLVTRPALSDLTLETLRVLMDSEGWSPATLKGEPVIYQIKLTLNLRDPDNKPSFDVSEFPRFRGEDSAKELTKFIEQQLIYPEAAAYRGISGRVTVSFTVKSDGRLEDVYVIRSTHSYLDNEAVRVIEASSKYWTPGKDEDGNPVPVTFGFPINFIIP